MRQYFLVIIVNCCSYDSNNSYYVVAGVQCAQYDQGRETDMYSGWTGAKTDARATKICSGSSAEVSSNKLNLLCFSWVALDETQPWNGFTCQKWLREGQGLWEVCRWKDNKSLTVVLYFFLLQDAPRSPSVLIGRGERSRARCADVNGAWRTSAAGNNIPTSLLPFLHPLARSLTHSISSASTSVRNI